MAATMLVYRVAHPVFVCHSLLLGNVSGCSLRVTKEGSLRRTREIRLMAAWHREKGAVDGVYSAVQILGFHQKIEGHF